MKRNYGKTWAIWLNDADTALLTAHLAAKKTKFSQVVRKLIKDEISESKQERDDIHELLLLSEPNKIREQEQVNALLAVMQCRLLLAEVLDAITGDRKQTLQTLLKIRESTVSKLEALGYQAEFEEHEGS